MLQALRRSRRLSPLIPSAHQAQQSRGFKSLIAFEEVKAAPSSGAAADGEPLTAVIVHGLLGQGRNWRTWARRLAVSAADATNRPWSILLVDQRCHGKSTELEGFKPPHTLGASATDLAQLFRGRNGGGGRSPDILIGHSLGGKVLLEYLAKGATGLPLPKQVWVLDSNPGRLPRDRSDVARVMAEIGHIPVPLRSRDDLLAHLQERGFSEGLRLWLGSNLVPDRARGGFTWTFDLNGAWQLYEDYKANDYWHMMGNVAPGVTLNLVRAANSDRWTPALEECLAQAEEVAADGAGTQHKGVFRVQTLPDAGHWLHVDNPDGLLDMVLSGCKAVVQEDS